MHTSPTQFVIAIVFPGADNGDVVSAAVRHHVHIVDKEKYVPGKDYAAVAASYEPYINGSRIQLLFVFPEGNTVLASTDAGLDQAIRRIREMSN